MNRIDVKFKNLQARRKKAFIAFITAGDPDLQATESLVPELEKAGADIIELGVPFSDPLADGPTIQASYERALRQQTTLKKILFSVKKIRQRSEVPIVLMSSYNPIFRYGDKNFVQDARKAGVDGLIIPDLPPEEAQKIRQFSKASHLSLIFLIAPTTTPQRIKTIAQAATGFIYYVSLTGVTGARNKLPQSYKSQIMEIRRHTSLPICVGFGISTVNQVRAFLKTADGVIVGSAIVNKIHQQVGQKKWLSRVSRFVSEMSRPC